MNPKAFWTRDWSAIWLVVCLVSAPSWAVEIPYSRYVLDNGLTVIVHEDPKAPVVAVNLWYRVGSKDEPPGRTGFAHLFEHIMFGGSENHDRRWRETLEAVGATDVNGTTNTDRTNYFQTVPTSALDTVLFLESDRMGHLLGALTQPTLDRERDVVRNEKREKEDQPYGEDHLLLVESSYPAGHPYSWRTIGSMEDLGSASLADVRDWFKTWYHPANAVLVIAGDVPTDDVLARVELYFGDIPPGPKRTRPTEWVAKRSESRRVVHEDRVPQARLYRSWNVGPWGHQDNTELDLLAVVLAEGKASRLYDRLVTRDRLATGLGAFLTERQLGGTFFVGISVHPDARLADVESALDKELERLLAEGPTADEVARARTLRQAAFLRGLERVGGFGGKSDILAAGEIFGGDPGWHRTAERRRAAATPDSIRRVARDWLSEGDLTLEVLPHGRLSASPSDLDRSDLPLPDDFPKPRFPAVETARLDNGLRVVVAERRGVPLVEVRLALDAGRAADRESGHGTAALTLDLLDEGAAGKSAVQLGLELERLGANLSTDADGDLSYVQLSALRSELAPSLDLLADVVLQPDFPAEPFERVRREHLARIEREKSSPGLLALRLLPALVYGEDHAYSAPVTGTGHADWVGQLEPEHLRDFHRRWFVPSAATLLVTGDVSLDEILPLVEAEFGDWSGDAPPTKTFESAEVVNGRQGPMVYLVDRAGSEQSVIFAAQALPPAGKADLIALQTLNLLFGATPTSRLNANLRQDKGWSYGAGSSIAAARGPGLFLAQAPVQTDKTAPALAQLALEIAAVAGDRPPTEDEVRFVKSREIRSLPGLWETHAAVLDHLSQSVRFGFDEDHWARYPDRLESVSTADVRRAAAQHIELDRMVFLVIGDLAEIEEEIRALRLGEVIHLDADGRELPGS